MKKNCMLFIAILTASCCLAKDFQKGGYAYVDAPTGLRVRSGSSLKARKICFVQDRMKAKILETGPKATIDGISSNWIRILLPIDSYMNQEEKSGWVFGGYLTNNLKPFSTAGWTDQNLILYLSRFTWIYNDFRFMHFSSDGKYRFGLMETSLSAEGTYHASMKDRKITVSASYGDDSDEWTSVKVEEYKIISISEDKLILDSGEEQLELSPALFSNGTFFSITLHKSHDYMDISFYHDSMYALLYSWSADYLKKKLNDYENYTGDFYENMKLMGIELKED